MSGNGNWVVLITDDEGDERVFVSHVKSSMARLIAANLQVYFPQSKAEVLKW